MQFTEKSEYVFRLKNVINSKIKLNFDLLTLLVTSNLRCFSIGSTVLPCFQGYLIAFHLLVQKNTRFILFSYMYIDKIWDNKLCRVAHVSFVVYLIVYIYKLQLNVFIRIDNKSDRQADRYALLCFIFIFNIIK